MTPACSACTGHEYYLLPQHLVVKAALCFAFAMSSCKQSEASSSCMSFLLPIQGEIKTRKVREHTLNYTCMPELYVC